MSGYQKTMAVGPRGEKGDPGEPGKDGTGTGTVTKVNDIEPDEDGNVTLPLPPEQDISGLATKIALKAHEDKTDNPHKVTTRHINYLENYTFKMSDSSKMYPTGISTFFVGKEEVEGGWPGYGSVTTTRVYSNGGATLQIYTPYGIGFGGSKVLTRFGTYPDGVWTDWEDSVSSKLPDRINAVLAAGWTNLGGEYQSLTYYKDQFGVVHVNGAINKGAGAGHLATTLPVGIRPLKINLFYGNLKDGLLTEIVVNPNGTLSISGPTNTIHSVNISFRTD